MPNPYAGAIGYNTAIRHAVQTAARVIDETSEGDGRLIGFGAKIVIEIAALQRKTRYRRTKQELAAIAAQG